jgi:diacylglycerol kinase family enzyme
LKIALIVNLSAGSHKAGEFSFENIKKSMDETKLEYDIFNIDKQGDLILNELKDKYDAVAAVGGDGTVNFTANILAGSDIPMAIIPAGTLNHFARDNKIPLTLNEAVGVISKNNIKALDLASVNGHIFVNNSSLGLYALAVRERDKQQSKHGLGKWSAMLVAIISVFKRFPLYNIHLETKDKAEGFRSPIIFVGNNEYRLDPLSLGERESMDKGILSVYIARCKTRFGILKLVIAALFNRLSLSENFEMKLVKEARIESRKKGLHVSYDGEVKFMETPIIYKILPKHIKVIVPAE